MNKKIKIPGGLFVAIEGIDGTGKTTLARNLNERLSKVFEVTLTQEPSDTVYGRRLRQSFEEGRLTAEEELELFVKDREEHLKTVIKPGLENQKIVITDRYFFSNIAYQGAYGIDTERIKKANMNFPLPDIVLFLFLDIGIALERISNTRGNLNIVERKENITKVKNIYNVLEREYKNIFRPINSDDTVEEVCSNSLREINKGVITKVNDKELEKTISAFPY